MPLESQTARLLGAPRPDEASVEAHLLAAVYNAVRGQTYAFVKAHTKKGTIVPEPRPIRLPVRGDEQHKARPATPEELAAALGRGGRGTVRYEAKSEAN